MIQLNVQISNPVTISSIRLKHASVFLLFHFFLRNKSQGLAMKKRFLLCLSIYSKIFLKSCHLARISTRIIVHSSRTTSYEELRRDILAVWKKKFTNQTVYIIATQCLHDLFKPVILPLTSYPFYICKSKVSSFPTPK